MKVFKEEQRFTQLWLHILLLMGFIVPIIIVVKEYIASRKNDDHALVELIIIVSSMVLVYGIIFLLKLKTRIDEQGIKFRFIPFHFTHKSISWSEIEKAYVRKYDAISEYGGWGMKGGALWRKNKGVAYNVQGNLGLQLELKTGKKILIGTQKEAEINSVLRMYNNKTDANE